MPLLMEGCRSPGRANVAVADAISGNDYQRLAVPTVELYEGPPAQAVRVRAGCLVSSTEGLGDSGDSAARFVRSARA
jgi:hypothetical protein